MASVWKQYASIVKAGYFRFVIDACCLCVCRVMPMKMTAHRQTLQVCVS